jgi:osmotically-inducible protein OsmY
LFTCLSALPLIVGLMGCASDRHNQSTGHPNYDNRVEEPGDNHITDQRVEDSRTAERVREALAAAPQYTFNGVKVAASNGVVQLSGFVNTGAQRTRAGEVASKVVGVKSVENNLAIKD